MSTSAAAATAFGSFTTVTFRHPRARFHPRLRHPLSSSGKYASPAAAHEATTSTLHSSSSSAAAATTLGLRNRPSRARYTHVTAAAAGSAPAAASASTVVNGVKSEADVVIIGGGLSGLCAAKALTEAVSTRPQPLEPWNVEPRHPDLRTLRSQPQN
jgi:hypothetical protein